MPTRKNVTLTSLPDLLKGLRTHLSERQLNPHQLFLSQYEIEKKYKTTINLAKMALDQLESEGLIYRLHRRGSYVSPLTRNRPLLIVVRETDLQSPQEPVMASMGKLIFFQGVMDALDQTQSNQYAQLITSKKLLEIKYDLPHVYRNLSGVILFRDAELLSEIKPILQEAKIPLVFYGSSKHLSLCTDIHHYTYDETKITELALSHLLQRQKRRIAFVQAPNDPLQTYRQQLFMKYLDTHPECTAGTIELDLTLQNLENRHLQKFTNFEAAFCADDSVATYLMNQFIRHQWKIPEKLSLVGVNNYPMSFHSVVPLTTVDIPLREDAKNLVQQFSKTLILKDAKPFSLESKLSLILRESS